MLFTLLMGLASRHFFGEVPFVKSYVGDALWALMVYFGVAFLFSTWSIKVLALATIIFSFGIEISQIYHAPWIDNIRASRLGGLVLGFTFVWSDFLCYCVGVLAGVALENYVLLKRFSVDQKTGY